jgi:hypothetical protein
MKTSPAAAGLAVIDMARQGRFAEIREVRAAASADGAGSGPSSPAEYEAAQHVDPEVVAAIAAWLTSA